MLLLLNSIGEDIMFLGCPVRSFVNWSSLILLPR